MSMDGSPKVLVIKYFLKRIGDCKRKVKDLKIFSSKEVSGGRVITLNFYFPILYAHSISRKVLASISNTFLINAQ